MNEKFYVNIEKVDKKNNLLIIDFINFNNTKSFLSKISESINDKDPSMIVIKNYNGKYVREKVTYELNPEIIPILNNTKKIFKNRFDSYIIGYEINMESINAELFLKSKSFSKINDFTFGKYNQRNEQFKKLDIKSFSINKVIIRNVGQGNWNEMYFNSKLKVIFDIGAKYQIRKEELEYLVKSRIERIMKGSPLLIISHWDVDHYHCLFGLKEEQIAKFSMIIFRTLPQNNTAKRAYYLLSQNNRNCYPLDTEEKALKGEKIKNKLTLIKKIGNLLIFNAMQNNSKNQMAISIAYRSKHTTFAFPSDLNYNQVSDYIYIHFNYQNQNYLVVPHHGGKAGEFKLNINKCKPKEAIISVGNNAYGHPLKKYKNSLKEKGFTIKQTNIINRDYELEI